MSNCKGLEISPCKQRANCSYVNGKTRKYCRSNTNSLANQHKELKNNYNDKIEELLDLKNEYNKEKKYHQTELKFVTDFVSNENKVLVKENDKLLDYNGKLEHQIFVLQKENKDLLKQYNELVEENMELKENYNELIEDRINSQNELKEERQELYNELIDLEDLFAPINNDTEDSLYVKNFYKNFEKLKHKLKAIKTQKITNPKSLKNRYKKTMKRRS